MPLYAYDCFACQNTVEVVHKFKEAPIIKCKSCGATLRKRFSELPLKPLNSRAMPSVPHPDLETHQAGSPSSEPHPAYLSEEVPPIVALHKPDGVAESMVGEKNIIQMDQEAPRLSEDVDPNKLMVEIVQGLLMAHERLDRMETSLRQAVETASQEHLNSFNRKLRDVDVRFQQTTRDAEQAVKSLHEARADLIRSVEGSGERHLDTFNRQVKDIDRTLSSNLKAVQEHQNILAGRLKDTLDAQNNALRLENAKQGENWKNLDAFLKNWQIRLNQANTELMSEERSNASTIAKSLKAVEVQLVDTTTQLANTNRRLLIWLVRLAAVSLILLGAAVYKMFVH